MWPFKLSKKKRYATGFKWGRREHNAETRATKVLLLTILVLGLHLWLDSLILGYISMGLLILTLGFRLIAAVSHKQEKRLMDELRFHRNK